MTWIRSPVWDCVWILSAPLLGFVMVLPLGIPFGILVVLNFAHVISPIALAWGHDKYRRVMLERPGKFIGVPLAVMALGTGTAVVTWMLFPEFRLHRVSLENLDLTEGLIPFVVLANLYAVWNLYHAGAQNFGFLCLYRRSGFQGRRRLAVLGGCIALTVFLVHEIGRLPSMVTVGMFCAGAITINHWLAAIGLSAHVHARHHNCSPLWFAGGVLVFGVLSSAVFHTALYHYSMRAAIMALCLRAGFGIWHFLQDRWIWKLSDPQVRATIGRDLFAAA